MCDKAHYDELERKVGDHDTRLRVLESGMADFREETRSGLAKIDTRLTDLYEEKTEWGKLARGIVSAIVKWLMWLIPALVGLRMAADKFFAA